MSGLFADKLFVLCGVEQAGDLRDVDLRAGGRGSPRLAEARGVEAAIGAGAAGGMVRAYSVNYDEQFVLRAIAGEALHSTETELANQQGESLSESLTNDRGETKLVQHERSDRLHIKF